MNSTKVNDSKSSTESSPIQGLLELSKPLDECLSAIESLNMQNNLGAGFTLNSSHIRNVIESYLKSGLTVEQVEDWANAVESMTALQYPKENELAMRQVVHYLANPNLTQPLTQQFAHDLIKLIE